MRKIKMENNEEEDNEQPEIEIEPESKEEESKLGLDKLNFNKLRAEPEVEEGEPQPTQKPKGDTSEFLRIKYCDLEVELSSFKYDIVDLSNLFQLIRKQLMEEKKTNGGSYLG